MQGGPAITKPIVNIDSIDITKHYTGAYEWTIRGTLVYPDSNLGAHPDPNAYGVFVAAADLHPIAVSIIESKALLDSTTD